MTGKRFAIKFLAFILVSLFFSGCEKDKSPDDPLQDVVFGISHVDPFELKTDGADIPECPEDENGNMLMPTIADIVLKNSDGDPLNFTPQVFYLNGNLYSQAIKLPPGTYTVEQFLLRTELNGTIIMATPAASSAYADYISPERVLGFSFEIKKFEKSEVQAEVLCFEPASYAAFGFHWFNIHQTVVKNFCFFGDICAMYTPEYQEETAYGGSTNGGNSPWWYFYDNTSNGGGSQPIYAGQHQTEGTVTIANNILTIDLGSWSLQDIEEPVKVLGFDNPPNGGMNPWIPPGQFDIKTDELTIDLSGYLNDIEGHYPYYIIHMDVRKETESSHDFAGSLYEYVVNGLQMDVPAIFRIDVSKNGQPVPFSPFSNVDLDDDGNPLPLADQTLNNDGYLAGTNKTVCARYPVRLGETGQEFTFELYLWVPGADGGFSFQHFYTFTATDEGPLMNENGEEQIISNGFVDFVLGDCHHLLPDLLLDW